MKRLSLRLVAVITFAIGLCLHLIWSSYIKPAFNESEVSSLEVSDVLVPVNEVSTFLYYPNPLVNYALLTRFAKELSIYEPIPEPPLEDNTIALGGALYVSIDDKRRLTFIDIPFGTLSDPVSFSTKLRETLQIRGIPRQYKPGMKYRHDLPEDERVYKTVLIFASRSVAYEDVIRLIAIVRAAGANRIALNIGDLSASSPGEVKGIE